MVGVTVVIKGYSSGAVTDSEGKFQLHAPKNGMLHAHYADKTTYEKNIYEAKVTPEVNFVIDQE